MKTETKLAKAKAESEDFGRYAEVMLEEIPDMSLPVLRDCYKHHATAGEFRAHMERQRNLAQRAQAHEAADVAKQDQEPHS